MSDTLAVSSTTKSFNAVGAVYNRFYQAIMGDFLDNLHTNLYERYIKAVFSKSPQEYIEGFTDNPEYYYSYLIGSKIPKKYEIYVSYKLTSMAVILIAFSLAIYLFLAHMKIFASFQSKAFEALAFYLFLVLPFKNTCLISSIRGIFSSILSLLSIHNFILIDELAYLILVLMFYLCLELARFAYKNRAYDSSMVGNMLKKYINPLKAIVVFTGFLLYALNVIFLLGNVYILILSCFLGFIFSVGLFYTLTSWGEMSFLFLLRKTLKAVGLQIFSFVKLSISLCYILLFFVILFRSSFMNSYLGDSICYHFDSFFYYLFIQDADLHCFIFKILILILLLLYCAVRTWFELDKKEQAKNVKRDEKKLKNAERHLWNLVSFSITKTY